MALLNGFGRERAFDFSSEITAKSVTNKQQACRASRLLLHQRTKRLGIISLPAVWGLVLAVPITAAIKAVCERVEDWSGFAELLSH